MSKRKAPKRITLLIGVAFCAFIVAAGILLITSRTSKHSKTTTQKPDYKANIAKCNSSDNKTTCYEKLILNNLRSYGVEKTFDLVVNIYEADKGFATNCHYYTHIIGAEAYHRFKNKEEIKLTYKTTYCGFGFYHGFVENLLQESNNIEEVRKFCYDANKTLSGYTSKSWIACFHGIGHGAVDGEAMENWGGSKALVDHGLTICSLLPLEEEKRHCASGAYNSLAIAYISQNYKLKGNKDNPFVDCLVRNEKPYRLACYDQMNMYVLSLTNNNLLLALRYTEKIQNDEYAQTAAESIASATMQHIKTKESLDEAVYACQHIQKRLIQNCVYGVVGGLMEFGKPNFEYELALDFCNKQGFSENLRTDCFTRLSDSLSYLYPKAKFQQICQQFPERFHNLCTKRQNG